METVENGRKKINFEIKRHGNIKRLKLFHLEKERLITMHSSSMKHYHSVVFALMKISCKFIVNLH